MNIRDLSGDELLVFETLQKGRPATKKDLESRLGWTASTTNRVIQSLLQKGGVMETGQLESSGGRRPSLFDIQAQQGCLLGIHISFGFVRMVLCDLKMRPLEREVLLVPPVRESPETVLESIAGTYREFLRRQKRQPREVLGAGLAVFGPMDREKGLTGRPMDSDQPIPAWTGLPIRDMLRDKLGIPVYADFACNAAALAEYYWGEHRNSRNLAFFLCDMDVSLGQIASGSILRRMDDRDDGFSHVSIDLNGELCYCGKRGCVRQYASVRAIIKRIRQRIAAGAPTLIPAGHIDFGQILDAARQGDETVLAALSEAGSYFASALSNYLNVMNPDQVIIGGSLTEAGYAFYDSIIDALVRYHGSDLTRRIRFLRSGSFGYMTPAVGAAALCYESLMGNPIVD